MNELIKLLQDDLNVLGIYLMNDGEFYIILNEISTRIVLEYFEKLDTFCGCHEIKLFTDKEIQYYKSSIVESWTR
jgi:hypothetical protein